MITNAEVIQDNLILKEIILGKPAVEKYNKLEKRKVNDYDLMLTKSGMISCVHLLGLNGLKKFIDSRGEIDQKDNNQILCSEYLKKFAIHNIDFSIDELQEQPRRQQQEPQAGY